MIYISGFFRYRKPFLYALNWRSICLPVEHLSVHMDILRFLLVYVFTPADNSRIKQKRVFGKSPSLLQLL